MQLNETTAYLDGSTFYEVIDPELMRQYALSIHASDYSDWEDKYYENEKTHLLKYIESFDKKNKLFRVDYTRKKKIGRVNPKASIGAVALPRATRNTLMRHNYCDFDIENAHPIILREIISQKYNIKTEFPCLDDYCNRRDELLREIMDAYKIDRKIAKNAFISMMYNGTPESWRKKNSLYFDLYDRKRCLVEELLDNFRTEIDKVITLFINANKEIYKRECDNYRKNKKNVGKKNERGSFLSTVMQEYELQLTSAVMKWCVENGLATFRDMPNCLVASYAYDGFMLLKENVEKYGGIKKLLDDLSQITFDLTGYDNIVWTNKDMNDEFNDFEYSHLDWAAFALQGGDSEDDEELDEDDFVVRDATDETVAIVAFEKLKHDFVYSRGQYFFKKDNIWVSDQDIFKSALRLAVMSLPIKKAVVTYDKKGNERVRLEKYCSSMTATNNVTASVRDRIAILSDDTFYEKLHSTVKGKLVFKDGVYDFRSKTFHKWGCEYLLKNPIYSVACVPRNFPQEDSVTAEFKVKCVETVYGIYTQKQTTDLLHFKARAAAGHIEDKVFCQQTTNRDSGKSVQCHLTMAALGPSYVGSVDYSNFMVQNFTGDDSAKSNGWLMPFQFKRFMLINESKGDVTNSNFKIDGGKIKSICSGGDSIEARAMRCNPVNIHIQCSQMIFNNDNLPVTTPDVFEKCLQITGQCQYKSQEYIDSKLNDAQDNPDLMELCKRQYRLADPDIIEKVKTQEWSDAFIRILIDNYKTTPVKIEKVNVAGDDNEMSLNESILECFCITGKAEDFVSNEELRGTATSLKASLKKMKEAILYIGNGRVREGKHRTIESTQKKGLFGISYQ